MGVEVHLGDEILELINPSELLVGPKFSIKAAKSGTTSLYVSYILLFSDAYWLPALIISSIFRSVLS
jgi:hypothetical protein